MAEERLVIDAGAALTMFKSELLRSLSPEQKELILNKALVEVMKLSEVKDRWAAGGGFDFTRDGMGQPLRDLVKEIAAEVLNTPENRAKLRAELEKQVDRMLEAMSERMTKGFMKAVTGSER